VETKKTKREKKSNKYDHYLTAQTLKKTQEKQIFSEKKRNEKKV